MPKNLQDSEKSATFALANEKYRGVEQLVARQAHNLEVACSSPASATTTSEKQITKAFRTFFVYTPVQKSDSIPVHHLLLYTCLSFLRNYYAIIWRFKLLFLLLRKNNA